MSNILYRLGRNQYINLTNKCPCDCTFCYRNIRNSIGDSDNLWLDAEPTVEEVMAELFASDLEHTGEVVFCGYGEPTERLDDLLEIAKRLKEKSNVKIRLDTNGLGNLVNGRDIIPDLAQYLDSISISLNAPNAEVYGPLCRPIYEPEVAHKAILDFIKGCKGKIPAITVSVVGGTLTPEDQEECRKMVDSFEMKFRVRR